MRSASAMRAGILLGLVVGAADAAAVLIENPRSFSGWRSPAGFAGASMLLHLALGLGAGVIFAVVRRIRGTSPRTLFTIGLAFAIFVWVAIRIHVHWYFGEPLTSARSAPAYTAAALGAMAAAFLLVRALRRPIDAVLERRPQSGKGLLAIALVCVLFVVLAKLRPQPGRSGEVPAMIGARNILLITLDTTRADHLSCYGYPRGTTPAIDRLARRGMMFENAYASIPLTNPNHTTMLTGLSPREHGVLNNGMPYQGEKPTCVEALAGIGYRCAAFVSGIPLKSGLSGLDRGFTVYDDSFSMFDRLHPMVTSLAWLRAANRVIPMDLVERRARDTVPAAIRWLRKSENPRFAWVHLYDPHSPYDAPSVLRARFAKEADAWSARGKPVTEWPIADYDAELREMDRYLEDLLREWEIRTTIQEMGSHSVHSAVVLTADHGEGLEQHGELTHGQLLHEEDLRVPWIEFIVQSVKSEGGSRRTGDRYKGWINTNSRTRSSREIDSTIRGFAGRVGVRPWGMVESTKAAYDSAAAAHGLDVHGLLAETFAPEGRESKAAYVETERSFLDRGPTFGRKLIVNFATGETQAYDLATDPGETRPLDSSGEDWAGMRAKIPAPDSTTAAAIDPEVKRRLESLGYVH